MTSLQSNTSFIRLFLGRIVTNAGDSIYLIAAMWLIFDLTGSSFYTGIAGFLLFGTQPLQFLTGPLVDRWPLSRVLAGTQLVQFFGVLVIPVADAFGVLNVWIVLAVIPVLAFVNQFVYPAQNAALPQIVDEDNLVRANSLFSFAYQGIDLVFNAASGVLIAVVGAVTLYVLDAVTFAVAFLLFVGISVADDAPVDDEDDADDDTDYVAELREGFGYIRGSAVFAIILGAIAANFAFGMMMAVLPAYAASLGGPEVYGLLMAALSGGSLAGAAGASFVDDLPFGTVSIVANLAAAGLWAGVVLVPGVLPTVALFFAAFVPTGVINVMSSSMLQSAVDDTLLGRVMSVRSSISTAMMPIGSLLGGVVATAFGTTVVLFGMVAAMGFFGLYFLVHPRLRSLPTVDDADEQSLGLGSPVDSGD